MLKSKSWAKIRLIENLRQCREVPRNISWFCIYILLCSGHRAWHGAGVCGLDKDVFQLTGTVFSFRTDITDAKIRQDFTANKVFRVVSYPTCGFYPGYFVLVFLLPISLGLISMFSCGGIHKWSPDCSLWMFYQNDTLYFSFLSPQDPDLTRLRADTRLPHLIYLCAPSKTSEM